MSSVNKMGSLKDKKVAWLVTSMGYGDSLMYWENILQQYLKLFPGLRVFASEQKKTNPDVSLPFEYSVNLLKIPLGKGISGYNKQIILAKPGIIFQLYKYQPDLIVISEFGILSIYGLIAAAFSKRTKVLLLVENYPYQGLKIAKISVRKMIRKGVCYLSDSILTNNNKSKEFLINTIGVNPDKINVAPYLVSEIKEDRLTLIDDKKAATSPVIKQNNKVSFLYVGQLVTRKGVDKLVAAVALLPQAYLDLLTIWIVGDGEQRGDLQQMVEDNDLQDIFVFYGKRPYQELAHYYAQADVFVLPTLNDYRALVGFEALSYGLPILQSNLDGAVAEVVAEGENGFSFDPYNIKELSEKIAWFIDNKERLPDFSDYSYNLSKEYTLDKAVENLVTASNQVLSC